MKISELIKTLQNTLDAEGDLPVTISVCTNNKDYIVSTPEFASIDDIEGTGKELCLKDWPY